MPPLWHLLLLIPAFCAHTLIVQGQIWLLYGFVTHRDQSAARLPFVTLRTLAILLFLVTLIAPIVALFIWGPLMTCILWTAGAFAVWLLVYSWGWIIESLPSVFFDLEKERATLRKAASRKEKMVNLMIKEWPTLPEEDRDKFLRHWVTFPLHMREALFLRLLDSFPVIEASIKLSGVLERLTFDRMKHWERAHLFNHIESILEMRHALSEQGVFRGHLVALDEPPRISFARVRDDIFVIGQINGE